ncbi:MAG: CaiB/BaiF CoA-transferase family protein [Methylacidiphilales bacterium]|nr:CaiB/BaiF CoA-transferase family protein [Candidatus Methylacidiphilales bacterium]
MNQNNTFSLLRGITVVEYSHMVMGPCCGVVLADLGARVIKVEPIKGDNTRRLAGSGAGYFPMYNRNKQSLAIDVNKPEGLTLLKSLIKSSDVFIENFRPQALNKYELDFDSLHKKHPSLIYLSLKGFLSGAYQNRTALDEVVQMFSGLAYMTGLPERPMRAGTSVVDITGALFGVIGILAMLEQRKKTNLGGLVQSSLFETAAFLVGQHIAQYASSEKPLQPMSVRQSAWSIYDLFDLADGTKLFVAVVSDTQWKIFCQEFNLLELLNDPSLAQNNQRVEKRDTILPIVRQTFLRMDKNDLLKKLDTCGVPFAPILQPNQLLQDQHLLQAGLVPITLSDGNNKGKAIQLPALPIEVNGMRSGIHHQVPTIGEDSDSVCASLGYTTQEITQLKQQGVIA